jgi:hypothetical protein
VFHDLKNVKIAKKIALYHEKRIALVNNFVCLVPLKNIVQGRKGYLKVEKKNPWESSFPLFYPSKAGMWKRTFPREISFPPSNILFFPGTIFFSGSRKTKMFTWDQGNSLFMIQIA